MLAQARGVGKTFRSGTIEATVLKNVWLEVRTGELALLMGPSGSGKTTLLCVLSGLLRPTTGEVDLCGVPISRLPDRTAGEVRRRNVGFVFQTYNLFPALSALDNVAEVLALKGMALDQARSVARSSLVRVGLADRLEHRPGELSGGERQRVAIARALAGDPSLIFGDEPTAALDRQTGLEVVELLKNQVNEGRGVLLVTHDVRLMQFADRVIEIEDGQIVRDEAVRSAAARTQAGAL
ncbi:ABC-type antimicrobial peptide transport system, ATPase component [Burkholderiales bacterium]|nr:ABC-type antimicrobial peptide transport system, ATPase component [Burkholderiales bacterium]